MGILFQRFPNFIAVEIFGLSKSERDLEKNIYIYMIVLIKWNSFSHRKTAQTYVWIILFTLFLPL
jgi:hypothetical protein